MRALLGAGLTAAFLAAVVLPPSAEAARASKLSVTPDRPLDSQPLTLSWKADSAPRAGFTYMVFVNTGDQFHCASNAQLTLRPKWKRKGATVRVTVRPDFEAVWCADDARLVVTSINPEGRLKVIAKATVPILDNSSTTNPDRPGQNVAISVLEGSSMTVKVPGRPDRGAPVTGTMQARTDITAGRLDSFEWRIKSTALTVGALPGDALCTGNGRAFPAPLAVSASSSRFWTSYQVIPAPPLSYFTLVSADDPLSLTGCQGPPSNAGLRPIVLAGEAGFDPTAPFTLRGSLSGVRLSEGADATIDLVLVLKAAFSPAPVLGPSG